MKELVVYSKLLFRADWSSTEIKQHSLKKRTLFMSSTLLCGLLCPACTFDTEGMHWLWVDTPSVAMLLAFATGTLGAFWENENRKLRQER